MLYVDSSHHNKSNDENAFKMFKKDPLEIERTIVSADQFHKENLTTKEKQMSEKNYRDLNKSIANLVRTPEMIPIPLETSENLKSMQPLSAVLGPRIPNFQFNPLSNSLQNDEIIVCNNMKGQHRTKNNLDGYYCDTTTPFVLDANDKYMFSQKEIHNFKKDCGVERHTNNSYLGSTRLQGKKISNVEVSKTKILYNLTQKYLLTEGDSPIGEKDLSNYRFSEKFSKPMKANKTQRNIEKKIRDKKWGAKRSNIFQKENKIQRIQNIRTEGDVENYNDEYEEKSSIFTPSFKCYEGVIKANNNEGSKNITLLNINRAKRLSLCQIC